MHVILHSGAWLHVALPVRARDITADDGEVEANVAATGSTICGGGLLWRSMYGLGFIALFLGEWDPRSATRTEKTYRNRRMVRPKQQWLEGGTNNRALTRYVRQGQAGCRWQESTV